MLNAPPAVSWRHCGHPNQFPNEVVGQFFAVQLTRNYLARFEGDDLWTRMVFASQAHTDNVAVSYDDPVEGFPVVLTRHHQAQLCNRV